MKKKAISLLLALVMMFSLVACGGGKDDAPATDAPGTSESTPGSESTGGAYAETVRIGYNEDLPSADPFSNTITSTRTLTNSTFDCLVVLDIDNGEVLPQLATSWEDVNGDGKVWEVKLRDDVTFHNGAKFTAEDVKFTWEYVTDVNNVVNVLADTGAKAVDNVEVVDEYTVRYNLKNSLPDFPWYLEVKILSKEAYDTMSKEEAGVIGTGPYYFNKDETQTGVKFTATRYDDYYGGIEKYPTKNLEFVVFGADDTMAAAMQAGEIDVMYTVQPALANTLDADPNVNLVTREGAFGYYLGFNYRQSMFADHGLKEAIAMAIDKEALVAIAYNGGIGGTISNNFCPPSGLGYDPSVQVVGYDAAAAKQYIEDNGYAGMKVRLAYPGLAINKLMCDAIQSSLKAVGVEVEIVSCDITNWNAFKVGTDYDMFVDACTYRGALLYAFGRYFPADAPINTYGYNSAEYQAAQDKVTNQPTYDLMVKEFSNLQKFVAEDLPVVPLCTSNILAACKPNVEGLAGCLKSTVTTHDFRTLGMVE